MTNPAHAGRMLFVNMPVADLERSKAFFAELGFSFNPAFTDDTAACMLVGEHAFVMLLSREKFAEFSKLPIADPTTHALALYCFSVSSRDEVDTVSAAALAAGGTEADDAEDHGFMYSRSFFDLDGHGWQVMWMDPAAARLQVPRRSPPARRNENAALRPAGRRPRGVARVLPEARVRGGRNGARQPDRDLAMLKLPGDEFVTLRARRRSRRSETRAAEASATS